MVTLSHPEEAPRADPHAGCCGSRGRKTPGDPMYARHGHELMGCKSPVGVPEMPFHWANTTTSRRQGQTHEGMSEGSPSAKVRADGQKPHRRLSPWASQHPMTKPARCRG